MKNKIKISFCVRLLVFGPPLIQLFRSKVERRSLAECFSRAWLVHQSDSTMFSLTRHVTDIIINHKQKPGENDIF